MMSNIIPGVGNILKLAQTVIKPQPYIYMKYQGRVQNSLGQWITSYFPDEERMASIQPIKSDVLYRMGMDTSKKHITILDSIDYDELERDASSDRAVVNGKTYKLVPVTDWFKQNGWDQGVWMQLNEVN